MTINLKKPDITELKPRITVFGVGGGGGNAVNNMINAGLKGVDFVVANTDAQALTMSRCERIVQLGGEPDFSPDTLLSRSHAKYDTSSDLRDMVRANLTAERVAVESYRQMIALIGDKDPTTRRMLEGILAVEEEHADELKDLLER